MRITQRSKTRIIPVAGGKGGVGKTELCANIGVSLGQLGYTTLLIDLDLGGSNLHSTLGLKNRNLGIGNFLSDRSIEFHKLITRTPYENLFFIPGDVLVAGTPNINFAQKQSIINNIEKLEYDYILIDLGSGASNYVVDFFLISNSGLVVTTPNIAALLNAYSFLKNMVFRFLIRAFNGETKVEQFLRTSIKERRPGNPTTIANIIAGMEEIDSNVAQNARRYISLLKPLLVLNLVRNKDDLESLISLRDLAANNLDLPLDTLGMLVFDEEISQGRKLKQPVVLSNPDILFSTEVQRIVQKIVQSPEFPLLPLATEMYADSYDLMNIESELDLQSYQENINREENKMEQEQLGYIEIINSQHKHINELEKTLRMLTLHGNKE